MIMLIGSEMVHLNKSLRSSALTDVGMQRASNQDTYICNPELGVFAVIDGIGGYAGGEVAAEIARVQVESRLLHPTASPEVRLKEAIIQANNEIFKHRQEHTDHADMGCVLTAALVVGSGLYVAHVGDTRLYRIYGNQIIQMTRDDSLVGQQEGIEAISEAEAMSHPQRNLITKDIGSQLLSFDDEDDHIYVKDHPFLFDSAYLLCSDGLSDMLTKREICDIVNEHKGSPSEAVKALVDRANKAGGRDNITALLIEGPLFGAYNAGYT